MVIMKKIVFSIFIVILNISVLLSQGTNIMTGSNLSGNFQLDAQSYSKDTLIGADNVPQKLLSNAYFMLNYRLNGFTLGLRYESYTNPPILGYDPRYAGNGFAYRTLNYANEFVDVTAGNFYEQFGSGMIFRAYEERQLGFDNSVDGAKVKIKPVYGIEITGLIGKQKSFWGESDGMLRAGNIDINVNNLDATLLPENLILTMGASVVSRYQVDPHLRYNQYQFYIIPENVLAYSGRFSLNHSVFAISGEFGYKYNDPKSSNEHNYNNGSGLVLTASYFPQGFGATLNFHRIDNMDFRTNREALGNNLNVNFLPPLTQQHTYRLATVYPFATQLNGEIGFQAEVNYAVPKQFFDDKYGATVHANYSRVNSLDTSKVDDFTYKTNNFFGFGKRLYFSDLNFGFEKKWSKTLETHFMAINLVYDKDVMENQGSHKYGDVKATILVLEGIYKFTPKNALRMEFQHLWAKIDSVLQEPDNINGNWAFILAEYSFASHWFVSMFDEYNYGNVFTDRQLHYLNASATYKFESTMISLSGGKLRGGLLCVGGVCRLVPASYGVRMSITTSF